MSNRAADLDRVSALSRAILRGGPSAKHTKLKMLSLLAKMNYDVLDDMPISGYSPRQGPHVEEDADDSKCWDDKMGDLQHVMQKLNDDSRKLGAAVQQDLQYSSLLPPISSGSPEGAASSGWPMSDNPAALGAAAGPFSGSGSESGGRPPKRQRVTTLERSRFLEKISADVAGGSLPHKKPATH